MNTLRPDMPPLPANIAKLPIDERGYPVPFFVSWLNGKPEFRLADGMKMKLCVIQKLCWVCGQKLRGPKTFVIGPMCVINRNSGEPPSHLACAEFSAKACPFLTRPNMERREEETMRKMGTAGGGIMISRNPAVTCLWTTLKYEAYKDSNGGQLFNVGDPVDVKWYSKGRPATREEVVASIESGLPILKLHCRHPDDLKQLEELHARAVKHLPNE